LGTLSLVGGIILILIGIFTLFSSLIGISYGETISEYLPHALIIEAAFIIVGSLLIRKYDADKKKEKGIMD